MLIRAEKKKNDSDSDSESESDSKSSSDDSDPDSESDADFGEHDKNAIQIDKELTEEESSLSFRSFSDNKVILLEGDHWGKNSTRPESCRKFVENSIF